METNFETVAGILQQKIGDLVAEYEGQIAWLKDSASQQIDAMNKRISVLEEKNDALEKKRTADTGPASED